MESWRQASLNKGYEDSHILSIDIKGEEILLGTYGRGALLSRDDGQNWTVFDTSKGLSWNFVLGGAWDGDYIVLAMLGDGVNISADGGVKWNRYGFNFFGISAEILYLPFSTSYKGNMPVSTTRRPRATVKWEGERHPVGHTEKQWI